MERRLRWLAFLALFAAALVAHRSALTDLESIDPSRAIRAGELAPEWSVLLGNGPATKNGVLWMRVALCASLALLGAFAVRLAVRRGASKLDGVGAGLLVVASSAAASVLWQPSGPALFAGSLVVLVLFNARRFLGMSRWGIAGLAVAASAGLMWVAPKLVPALDFGGGGRGEHDENAAGMVALARDALRNGLGFLSPTPYLSVHGTSLVPLAFLLPLIGAVPGVLLGRPRGLLFVAGAGVLVAQCFLGGRRESRDMLERAMPSPIAAVRLSERDSEPMPLQLATLARPSLQVEERLALQAAAMLEDRRDPSGALDWLERWLADRDPAFAPLAEARARRLELLLALRGPEVAANRLTEELPKLAADRRYVASVAAVMVESLYRSADDPRFVATVLPLLERLLESAASNPDVASAAELECLALLRVGQGRYVEAVTLAERAVRKDPTGARPHLVLARIYLGRGEKEAGLREVAIARRLAPQDPAGALLEGRLLCSSADMASKGVDRMLAAFAVAPGLPGLRAEIEEGLFVATVALLGRDQGELAGRLLDRTIAAVGRRPGLVHALGQVAMRQKELERAVELFEEAYSAEPKRPDLTRDLAEALRDAGYDALLRAKDREKALACFERAIAVAPPDFEVGGMKVVVDSARPPEVAMSDPTLEAARRAFDEATRLYAANDKEGAKKELLRSIELLPMNPLAHLNLGRIELELDHAKEAESHLRTAVAIGAASDIDVEEAYPFLVRALAKQDVDATRIVAVVDEYLARYPSGRFRSTLSKLKSGG